MDRSSPDFFAERGRNRCRHINFPVSDISIASEDIRDRSLELFEMAPNCARFGPYFFRGKAPKFWVLDYKIERTSDHVAKFHGDLPRELGDLALKKRKVTAVKRSLIRKNW